MTKSLEILPDKPWLAPLAGYSDLPFRILCRENGCKIAVTEMISAKGLIYGSQGTADLLETTQQDNPLVVQLFGAEEKFLALALEQLQNKGFTYFDLNCGCAVRKVTKTGSGAALLKDVGKLLQIAKIMIQIASPQCVGFKIRSGWSYEDPVYLKLSQELEQLGAGWITLHPRSATQGFTGQADWSQLQKVKRHIRIPIIASGDIFSAEDGIKCLKQTGVNGIMFARGALNDPAIFERYTHLLQHQSPTQKTYAYIKKIILRLCSLYTHHGMEKIGLLKMRTLIPKFLKGIHGVRRLRSEIVFCTTWDEIFTLLETYNPQ